MSQWSQSLPALILVFARCAGALSLAPPTSWRHFPVSLRLAVAGVLAVPLTMTVKAAPIAPVPLLVLVIQEAAIGLMIGLGLWLIIWAGYTAGHLGDALLWPQDEEGPLAGFFSLLTIVLFIQLNGHHWLLAFLHESFRALPPGANIWHWMAAEQALYWPGRLLAIALGVATPLLLAVVLSSLLLASAQSCFQRLHTVHMSAAFRYLVALLSLLIAAPLLGMCLLGQANHMAEAVARVVLALAS